MTGTKQLGIVILAGGQGKRMGGLSKALLQLDGVSFLQRIAAETVDFEERLLSANNPELAGQIGFLPVPDLLMDTGPMAGVYSALSAARSDALLVVPCDMPLFNRELAQLMIGEWREADDALVCVGPDGRIYPLCGIYSKNCLPAFKDSLDHHDFKMMNLLAKIKTRQLQITEDQFANSLFSNINTWDDYQMLENNRKDGI